MAVCQAGSAFLMYSLGTKEIGCNCTTFFLCLISLRWSIRNNISGEFLVPFFFQACVIEALTYLMQTGFIVCEQSLHNL